MGREQHRPGPYGKPSPAHRITGRLGEHACFNWMQEELAPTGIRITKNFKIAKGTGTDVAVGRVGLEVKSYRQRSWDQYGPSITSAQLPRIQTHSDAVVFWRIPDALDAGGDQPGFAVCEGWLPTIVLSTLGTPTVDYEWRVNLSLVSVPLRDPAELPDWAGQHEPRRISSPDSSPCQRCQRPRWSGHCWACLQQVENYPHPVWISERGRHWHPTLGGYRPLRERHERGFWSRTELSAVVAKMLPCHWCLESLDA
jgi:hypothetical protein